MIPLDPTPYPIDHILRGTARHPALIDREGAMTFAQAEAAVESMAGWLAGRGLSRGDRVATWLPKTRVACLMPLAVARAGLVHVPVNPALRRAQVAHILTDSGARLLMTQEARAATLEAGDVPGKCSVVDEANLRDGDLEAASLPRSGFDPHGLAAILYTSGSTGRPKGVMLSHANLWLGAVSVAHYLKLTPADRVLAVLPLSFDYGQSQLLSTWYAGASAAPLDYLAPRDVVKAVARLEATTLAGVPPLWVQLLEVDWPADTAARLLRLTNTGGALTPRMVRGLRARFPQADLYAMYGLTEAFRSTYLDPALVDANPDAIGSAIPFAESWPCDRTAVARCRTSRASSSTPGHWSRKAIGAMPNAPPGVSGPLHPGPLQGAWRPGPATRWCRARTGCSASSVATTR